MRRRLALAVLCAAQFVVVLDITIVTVALPAIRADLSISAGRLHWPISAYAVTFGGLLLVAGRLADVLGRRRVFLAGVALFGGASLMCAAASSGEFLAAARALQGAGGALASPAALALLYQSAGDGPARTRALAVWGTVGGAAGASGGVRGGLIVEFLGWRSIFLLNAPIAAAVLALGRLTLPAGRPGARRRIDPLAALLWTAAPMLVVGGSAGLAVASPGDPAVAGPIAGGVLAAAAARRRDRRSDDALLPGRVLCGGGALEANLVALLHGAMMVGSFLLLTLYMQGVIGLSPLGAGAGLLAVRAVSVAWAPLGSRLVRVLGAHRLMGAAMLAMTGALMLLARAPSDGRYLTDLLPGLLLLGVAIPPVFLTVNLIALRSAAATDAGVASGLLTMSQSIGCAIGAVVVTAFVREPETGDQALAGSIGTGLRLCAGLGILATAVVVASLHSRLRDYRPCASAGAVR